MKTETPTGERQLGEEAKFAGINPPEAPVDSRNYSWKTEDRSFRIGIELRS